MRLLEIYADEGDLQRGLNAAFRIACYQWRWYMESTVSGINVCFNVPALIGGLR